MAPFEFDHNCFTGQSVQKRFGIDWHEIARHDFEKILFLMERRESLEICLVEESRERFCLYAKNRIEQSQE